MKYIQTPFSGHRIFTFKRAHAVSKGKGYYKMNTSILKDNTYGEMVRETLENLHNLKIEDPIDAWNTFLLTIKSKSATYSKIKSKTRRKLKDNLQKQLFELGASHNSKLRADNVLRTLFS